MSQTNTGHNLDDEVAEYRDPVHNVDPLFVNRWSPRAMSGDSLAEDALHSLFEAARWAPSAFNNQHWRFVYATREDDEWGSFLDLLNEANRSWARDAGALIAVFSKVTLDHNGEAAATRSFDTGAAWQNLALEGARRDLAVHPMAGFDWDQIHDTLGVPKDEFDAEAMVAVGERADPETLPDELKEREEPSSRKPLDEIVFNGRFK